MEGIKQCFLTMWARSIGNLGRTVHLGDAADMPEAFIELDVHKSLFNSEAYLEYRLVYEFLDNTELEYHDRSDTYTVVRE